LTFELENLTATGLLEVMRLTGAGNVAIGATTSTAKLTVNNATDNFTHFHISTGGNARLSIGTDASANVTVRTGNSVDLRLGVGADHITIKSSGFVGINDAAPSYPLDVTSTGDSGVRVRSSNNHASIYIDSFSTGYNPYLRFLAGGTSRY
jgi:hypothetical protein